MAQIFISYGTADRPRAQTLARALEREGWSVWWDREIPLGSSFDDVIEQQLEAAQCVIVVWSRTSVTSNWVKVEAAEALRRRILIPLQIEECKIPLEFRRFQTAQLREWDGDVDSRPLRRFIDQVRRVLLVPPGEVPAMESSIAEETPGLSAAANAVTLPASGAAVAPATAVKPTPAATPAGAPAAVPAPTPPPRVINSNSPDVLGAGRPVFQTGRTTPVNDSPEEEAGEPWFRFRGPISWLAAGLVAVVMLVALYSDGAREDQEQPIATSMNPPPSQAERPIADAPARADAAIPAPATPKPAIPPAADSARPAVMTRETRIQSWLSASLYGHDNDVAALRRITITGTNDKYVALITNQFGFSCNLQFDSDGNPSDLNNCTSKTEPTWFVAESHIPLRCRIARSEEICSGPYTLGSENYKSTAEMVIARKIE